MEQDGKHFIVRTPVTGDVGRVFQAVGLALPPNMREAAAVVHTSKRPGQSRRGANDNIPMLNPLRKHSFLIESVESRRGAVAWAMRQRSVSFPRSSNRMGGFPASGSRTRHQAFALGRLRANDCS